MRVDMNHRSPTGDQPIAPKGRITTATQKQGRAHKTGIQKAMETALSSTNLGFSDEPGHCQRKSHHEVCSKRRTILEYLHCLYRALSPT